MQFSMAYTRKSPLVARPITRVHSEETRQRIRAIRLMDRLQTFALSSEQDGQYTAEEATAAMALCDGFVFRYLTWSKPKLGSQEDP